MPTTIQQTLTIPADFAGLRLDQALAKLLPDYSRTQIQEWIKNENITLNGEPVRTRYTVKGNETISIEAALKPQPAWQAQPLDLEIIHEDDAIIVINKPAGMVVHPGAGNLENTLLNALLHHAPQLQELPRAGIVHRLDKDTTGLLIIAKTPAALTHLTKQIKKRSMSRLYQAIVSGVMTSGGMVDAPIARHPKQRKKMAIMDTGKPAITHYRVMERYRAHTRIKVQLETGRTHQIRVHLASIQYPIFGDPVYGGRLQIPKNASAELILTLRQFKRQALHAFELGCIHPTSQQEVRWQAPLPEDMNQLITVLKNDRSIRGERA